MTFTLRLVVGPRQSTFLLKEGEGSPAVATDGSRSTVVTAVSRGCIFTGHAWCPRARLTSSDPHGFRRGSSQVRSLRHGSSPAMGVLGVLFNVGCELTGTWYARCFAQLSRSIAPAKTFSIFNLGLCRKTSHTSRGPRALSASRRFALFVCTLLTWAIAQRRRAEPSIRRPGTGNSEYRRRFGTSPRTKD